MFSLFTPIMGYLKIALYAAAFAAGIAACTYLYARPAIAKRDATIATMVASSEKDRADFIAAAAAKQVENARNEKALEARADVAASRTATVVRQLNAATGVFDAQIADAVRAAHDRAVSEAGPGQLSCDATTAAFGLVLQNGDRLATELATDAERLADQVRELQSKVAADTGEGP